MFCPRYVLGRYVLGRYVLSLCICFVPISFVHVPIYHLKAQELFQRISQLSVAAFLFLVWLLCAADVMESGLVVSGKVVSRNVPVVSSNVSVVPGFVLSSQVDG
jgi:hypothetical protein